jgi:hypothetical protein
MHLNDEFVTLRLYHNEVRVYSTPFSWAWDAARQNRSGKLAYVLQLIQSEKIYSEPISESNVFRMLTHNAVLPIGSELECAQNFSQFSEVSTKVPGRTLEFNLNGADVRQAVKKLLNSAN